MTTGTRRWIWSASLLALLTVPVLSAALPEYPETKRNADARAWAETLSEAKVTAYATTLASLPHAKQRAVFARMSPEKRSAYWQDLLNGYVRSHSSLTPSQTAAIVGARELLSPAYFSNSLQFRAANKAVMRTLSQEFSPADFAYLTGAASERRVGLIASALRKVRQVVTVNADPSAIPCDCSHEMWNPCGWTSLECSAQAECSVVRDGCWIGWLEWGDCYGLCGLPGESLKQ